MSTSNCSIRLRRIFAGRPEKSSFWLWRERCTSLARGFKRNIQRLTAILIEKLAIEVVASENSRLRLGKTYRVYSATQILRRRREAGYQSSLRDRSAVRLVKITDEPETAASSY